MAKEYLHSFDSETDFENIYYNDRIIKSFVTSAGTFIYDGKYEDNNRTFYAYKNNENLTALLPDRWFYEPSVPVLDANMTFLDNVDVDSYEYDDAYYEPWVSLYEKTVPIEMTGNYYDYETGTQTPVTVNFIGECIGCIGIQDVEQ